jgi:hypothetical protein
MALTGPWRYLRVFGFPNSELNGGLLNVFPAECEYRVQVSATLGARGTGAPSRTRTRFSVQAKRTERVEVLCLLAHSGHKILSRTFPELWKDFKTATQLLCLTSGEAAIRKARPTQILVRLGVPGNADCCPGGPVRFWAAG